MTLPDSRSSMYRFAKLRGEYLAPWRCREMTGGNQFGLGPLEAHQVCSAPDAHVCADWVAGVTPGAAERSGAKSGAVQHVGGTVGCACGAVCALLAVCCDGGLRRVCRCRAASSCDVSDGSAGPAPDRGGAVRSSSLDPATAHPISMDPPPLVSSWSAWTQPPLV
jgi:hypothetical protein